MNVAIVCKGIPLHSGEATWQAEIYVPQIGGGMMNHAGKVRTMCIRGPSRVSEEQAERDAKILNDAVPDGPKGVRQVANQMQRTKKGHDQDGPSKDRD
mmetsp:Transcript_27617/g.72938  ORF Transcript_27617/g.72938 Transcript_27617/m.72938 type:complete len:98 (+) Transcript_27617:126-419(+)